MKHFVILLVTFCFLSKIKADEGYWIPLFLGKNLADMQRKGLKLTAEDLYSINHSSLKDAVVMFGNNCSAAIISENGLLITNFQCAYNNLRELATPKYDFLQNGYWATDQDHELQCQGLSVSYLVRMEDVTERILENVADSIPEDRRNKIIEKRMGEIVEEITTKTHYDAKVSELFYGRQYILSITEEFYDVRLVGSPPMSLGAFGGDTDNWEWPRHTADFAVFRVYTDLDNRPALFSVDNVPYKPKKSLVISLRGYNQNDFVMTWGVPTNTWQSLPSMGIRMVTDVLNPHKENIRKMRMDIVKSIMDTSVVMQAKYRYGYNQTSSFYKKAVYETKFLKYLKISENEARSEQKFKDWLKNGSYTQLKYGNIFPDLEKLYKHVESYRLALEYINETSTAIDIVRFSKKIDRFLELTKLSLPYKQKDYILYRAARQLKDEAKLFFKNFDKDLDKKLFVKTLTLYRDSLKPEAYPGFFSLLNGKKFNGNIQAYADWVYDNSIITNEKKLIVFLLTFNYASVAVIKNDPVFQVYTGFNAKDWKDLRPDYYVIIDQINFLQRLYYEGISESKKDSLVYPDGNTTMRMTYGKVQGYSGYNGVTYDFMSTLDGVIQKANTGNPDYKIPDKLMDLYRTKNYSDYVYKNTVPACFLTNCHTTNGFQGGPVLNARGHLIGIHFDRNKEGVLSDYSYSPEYTRAIAVDIRYILFIIDKFGDSKRIMSELKIVK